jgi:heme/copper-type cytochrome/quinol oxidase subunit 4
MLHAQAIDLGDALKVGIGQEQSVQNIYATPADLVGVIVPTLFIIAGMLLFFLIFYSGFLYLQDTSKGKEEATKLWTTAGIGFIIMFIAYWIIQVIEVVIGQPIL